MNRRRAVVLLGMIAVAAVGVFFWQGSRKGAKPPSYRTEAVARGDVRVQVSATGTLNAVTTVQVGSQVSGTISALHADFNDRVRSGQVLAQLDPTFLRAQVLENRANLERAEVQYRQAVRDSARTFPLGARGLASQADLDQSQTAVESARAQVTSARAALQRAETNLRYATIQSPIDGVVVSRDVDVGQTVAASLSAPTLFTIAQDLTRMQLEAAVDEADIGQVKVGQTANFTVDAYPTRSFRGTVHQVRLAPETVQNVVTYTVIILVENDDLTLLPGMTANVTVDVDEARDVLKVPSTALRFRPDGGAPGGRPGAPGARAGGPGEARAGGEARRARERVFVLDGGRLRKVSVSPGLSDGSFTAIVSDSLREGELVVIGRETASGPTQSDVVNPFAPRMGGGGGGNRQGRGGR